MSPKRDTLLLGTSKAFTATVRTTAGLPQAATVEWVSLEPSVATVTQGTVTAVGLGSAAIVARVGLAADTAIVIVPDVVLSLQLTPSAVLASLGDTLRFEASLTMPDATTVPNAVVRWTLSDSASATLIRDGLVETRAAGDVTILASAGPYTAEATVRVNEPNVGSITISPTTASTFVGSTVQLRADLRDDRGKGVNGRAIVWSSSNTNVVTVGDDGVARGVGAGGAVVTARSSGRSASATVNVASQPANALLISVKPDTIGVGQKVQAVATPTDASGSPILGKVIAWQSSNPAVATVNASGLVTAIAGGLTTISAICDAKIASQRLYVRSPIATSISVNPNPSKVIVGGRAHLTAEVHDQSGNTMPGQTVSWTSLTPSVATVSTTGDVTAVSLGTAQVRAASATLSETATILVQTVPVASVAVAPSSLTLLEAASATLSATVLDSAGNTLSNRPITWSSSNPLVASVSTSGVVTAVAAGVASIMAAAEGKLASASVNVTAPAPAPVASVVVTLNSPTLSAGQTTQAVAQLYDAQGAVLTKRLVTWSSANPTLASVNSSGTVTAVSGGSVAIVAQSEGVTGGATLVVGSSAASPVATVSLTAPKTALNVGETSQLTTELRDAHDLLLTGRTLSFSSSNSTVATVSIAGVVTGVSAGTTTITAASEGKSSSLAFTVAQQTGTVASVTVQLNASTLMVGTATQATATLLDNTGHPVSGAVTWTSSNTSVATVSTSGYVTAVGAGTTQITASSNGKSGFATATVQATSSPSGLSAVTITLNSPSISTGQTTQAIASAVDGSGTQLSGVSYSWTVASGSGIVSLSSTTGGTITVTGVGAGTATLSVIGTLNGTSRSTSGSMSVQSGTGTTGTVALPVMPTLYSPTYPTVTGGAITVNAGGDFQAALNSATCGQEIVLQAGATFVGNFILPRKTCSGWVVVRSSQLANLPPGARVTPAVASSMAKIATNSVAATISAASGAHNWWMAGLEVTVASGYSGPYVYTLAELNGDINSLSTMASDIVLDRTYIHGTPSLLLQRGVALNGIREAVINSYCYDIHWTQTDTQCIAGWAGPGPYKIVNNTLVAATETIMFGGAPPAITNLVPSDIEIRRNYFYRPASWKGVWCPKNFLETKNAQRMLVEANVFDGNWDCAQSGWAWVLWPAPTTQWDLWSAAKDFTFRNNVIRNVGSGILLAKGYLAGYIPYEPLTRMLIEQNIFESINTGIYTGENRLLTDNGSEGRDVTVRRNTATSPFGTVIFVAGTNARGWDISENIFERGALGFFRDAALPFAAHFDAPLIMNQNVITPDDGSQLYLTWPATTMFRSTLGQAEATGKGADRAVVLAATQGVVIP